MKIIKLVIFFLFLFTLSCDFAPGSYSDAEVYDIKGDESEVVKSIKRFKLENPDYNVPKELNLLDGKSSKIDDHWYHIYFYYKDTDQIVYAWVRQTENDRTTLALVAINNGMVLGHWKYINKDFTEEENSKEKEKFAKLIVSNIK